MRPERRLADAVYDAFISPNESDRNMEPANVVDGLFAIARSIAHLANAIRDVNNPSYRNELAAQAFINAGKEDSP